MPSAAKLDALAARAVVIIRATKCAGHALNVTELESRRTTELSDAELRRSKTRNIMRNPPNKCRCDLCVKWSPLHRRIMAKLRGKDRKLFDEYLMMNAYDSDELGSANAKLAGEWSGWEWMKEAVKEQERKQANTKLTDSRP